MSYTVFIQKFNQQDPEPIDFKELSAIVSDFGKIELREFGHEIISQEQDMFEYASLMGESDRQFSGISFHRPIFNASFKQMVFQILEVHGTCFFDHNMETILVRGTSKQHLPEEIIENAVNGIATINAAEEVNMVLE